MPNWCNNVLTLRHTDPTMITRAREGFAKGELLNTFIPCPPALRDTIAGSHGAGTAAQAALELQEAANVRNHGHKNWYDWCVANWGTKWDVGDADSISSFDNNSLVVYFDSAWGPPTDGYFELEHLGFEVEAYFYEPGMAFCGSWINGIDETYEIPATSDEAVKTIPAEIDEMFNITQSMAEYEDENLEIDLDGGLSAINE